MRVIGTLVRINYEVRNLAGVLTDATVDFVATSPTGVPNEPAPVNDGVGLYHVDLTPDEVGRWTYVWDVTGDVVLVSNGILDIAPRVPTFIISLEAAKEQLNYDDDDHTDDDELQTFLSATTSVVEYHVGPVAKRQVTERHHVNGTMVALDLSDAEVPTVFASVTTGAVTVDVADLFVDVGSVVKRTDGGVIGFGVYDITYTAGRASIPSAVALAARIILAHLWATQRGSSKRVGSPTDTTSVLGYAVPNRALELLATEPDRAGGFA